MSFYRVCATFLALVALPHFLAAATFSSTSLVPSSQGQGPSALLQASDGNFYGVTYSGGAYSKGTIFKLTPSGVLTVLVNFNGTNGQYPNGPLVQASDGNLYGTAFFGGTSPNCGIVFKITLNGTLTTLADFNGSNGWQPDAPLIQGSDGNLYGTTRYGSDTGYGTAFKVTLGGVLTSLANFSGNSEGGLVQASDGNFYGTTYQGSAYNGVGSVYRLSPSGTFTTLVNFNGADGQYPMGSLIQGQDGNLYGTTYSGGPGTGNPNLPAGSALDYGTIFKITLSGTLTNLFNFNSTNGANPYGLVQASDGNFYGATTKGGSSGDGTIFQLTPSGTLTTLVNCNSTNTGESPGLLVQGSDGNLYGATLYGTSGSIGGTLFKMTTGGSLTTLHSLAADGLLPYAGLVEGTDGNFYGTTYQGGAGGKGSYGTVFRYTPGSTVTTVVSFNLADGANPRSGLIEDSAGNFYGTTVNGGSSSDGTIFQLTPSGTINTLVTFTGTNGKNPYGGLVEDNNGNFYGTTNEGGSSGSGTVFELSASGTLTTLVNFNLNYNGANPTGSIIQAADGNFYGTTEYGNTSDGSSGGGIVFQLTPSGTFTALTEFNNYSVPNSPYAGLVQGTDGNLYGTLSQGGSDGAVFKITTTGSFTNLVNFTSGNGANPYGGLIQASDGNFYGTTYAGGASGDGTIFQMTPSGTLTTMMSFNGTNGQNPYAGVVQGSDGALYGTTFEGGSATEGTIFRLDPSSSENVAFSSVASIPIIASDYSVNGSALNLTLNYAPSPGDVLTVIQDNGGTQISGTFTNLPNGGTISAVFKGVSYTFTANYSGGSGYDLTLTLTGQSSSTPAACDTPVMPPWILCIMTGVLFLVAIRCLPKARGE